MQTEIIWVDDEKIEEGKLRRAAAYIKDGGLCAFPTETVYGLGADAFNETAVRNIFRAKGRPSDNPLIVHISDFSMVNRIAAEITPAARQVMEAFMPGPITVILKRTPEISDAVTAGLDTVAIRFPSNPQAAALIRLAGTPIAAPSANLSGKPSPTAARHVIEDMNGRVDCILAGGDCSEGVESTVVDMTGERPMILRPGVVTPEQLRQIIPDVGIDPHVLKEAAPGESPKCPGMKYKHYAPDAMVTVVEGEPEAVRQEIAARLKQCSGKTGVIRFSDATYEADVVLDAGRTNKEYAANLFSLLRRLDELGVETAFAEFREEDGFGLAVKNRLYKAAAGRVIRLS